MPKLRLFHHLSKKIKKKLKKTLDKLELLCYNNSCH